MKINVTVEIKKLTPEIADGWLHDLWGEQRNLRKAHVARLASDMESGRFKLAPDAILRVKGKLANGQHRLAAVVQSGKPQSFIVMESNDEELYKVIDAGLMRRVSDGMIGLSWSKAIPSIARWILAYEANVVYPYQTSASGSAIMQRNSSANLTRSQMIDYCLSNRDILSESAAFVNPLYTKTQLLPLSIGGAVRCIGSKAGHSQKTDEFLVKVYLDGGGDAAGDFRNRLIMNKGAKAKLPGGYLLGLSIKSLKAFIGGKRLGTLKWVKGEDMPKI